MRLYPPPDSPRYDERLPDWSYRADATDGEAQRLIAQGWTRQPGVPEPEPEPVLDPLAPESAMYACPLCDYLSPSPPLPQCGQRPLMRGSEQRTGLWEPRARREPLPAAGQLPPPVGHSSCARVLERVHVGLQPTR